MKVNRWQQVKDRANRRARGLWKRNGSYYVQTTIIDPSTGLKKVSKLRLAEATDIESAKTEAGKLRQKIAAGETIHGKHGPTFSEYREHYIKTAVGKKPKTLYNENYFLKAWQEFLGEDTRIGSITKQNVLAFRVELTESEYSPRTVNLHVVTLRNLFKMAKIEGYVKILPTDGVTQLKIIHTERKLLPNDTIDAVCNEALTKHKRNGQQFADFIRLSKRKSTREPYTDPISKIIDGFRSDVKFEPDALLNQLRSDRAKAPGRFASALHGLLALATRKFCELKVKEGRIYHEFVGLPSAYRPFALFKGKPYVATLDIRACHPTFLGSLLRDFHQQEAAAIAAKLNRDVNRRSLEGECNRWTDLFTHPTIDPRGVIVNEAGTTIDRRDMKDCLNSWLNGAKKYQRKTDGKWDMRNNKRLEAWFQAQFPEMARVWTAMEQRHITGILITEEYEGPLMLAPALYSLAEGLGLTLSYEYDGVGVFAERGDPKLPAKLEKVSAFIQRQSVERFDVPVVVKVALLTQLPP